MEYLTDADYERAEKNGINRNNLYSRVYSYGWSIERAVTTPILVRSTDWAELKDRAVVSQCTFYDRKKKGWPSEQAALTPADQTVKKSAKLNKEHFYIALSNGISKNTVCQRVYKYRWPVERAITEPVNLKFAPSIYRR